MALAFPDKTPYVCTPFGSALARFGPLESVHMSNRAIWNVRKRHEWLAKPLARKRVKRSKRLRCGLQDAMDRKAAKKPAEG